MSDWRKHLETAGANFFQRYRKRLLLPGIALDICEELPELSLLDVMFRVHAGRQIIRNGDDFRALRAIRSGCWQRTERQCDMAAVERNRRIDRISRFQVILGSLLFAGFCLLSLLTASVDGRDVAWLATGSILVLATVFAGRRRFPWSATRSDAAGVSGEKEFPASV